ncbi:MAG: ATP-binding cassette domain-containing protein [Candidatus Malihini olakiniferum]
MQNRTSSAASATPHITLAHLHAGYGATSILNDIHLEITKGEFVALLGASGGGKTTLLRTIAGLATPDAGAVLVNGCRIYHSLSSGKTRYGAGVSQLRAVAAYDNGTVSCLRAQIATRVVSGNPQPSGKLESMLGLTGLGERKPALLSDGQR